MFGLDFDPKEFERYDRGGVVDDDEYEEDEDDELASVRLRERME